MERITLAFFLPCLAACNTVQDGRAIPTHLGGGKYEFHTIELKGTLYPKLEAFCAEKGRRFEEGYPTGWGMVTFWCEAPRYSRPADMIIDVR